MEWRLRPPSNDPTQELRSKWDRLSRFLGAEPQWGQKGFARILRAYGSRGEQWHGLNHLRFTLNEFQHYLYLSQDPLALEAALWFHDLVHRPLSPWNERASARWARRWLRRTQSPPSRIRHVSRLIRMTRSHRPSPDDPDARLLSDLDLAILGSSPEQYGAYREGIRLEHFYLPEPVYRFFRARRIRAWLKRPHLFQTPEIRDERESQARLNLQTELKALAMSGAVR